MTKCVIEKLIKFWFIEEMCVHDDDIHIICHWYYFRKTFKHVVKKKSTENFKGLPYITTLLSTSLWSFYGVLKPGGLLVLTVNGAGAVLHIIFVSLFLVYAPKNVKVSSTQLNSLKNLRSTSWILLMDSQFATTLVETMKCYIR